MTEPARQASAVEDRGTALGLVVDDDREVAALLVDYLAELGHTALTAHSGAEARTMLDRHDVDLVLLDLRLPDVDGVRLMQDIQRRAGAPEVIIVTGNATLTSAIAAVEAGAAGYVEKPVDLPRLGALVERSIERRRLLRENAVLLARLAERQRQAEALHEISRTIIETLDFREALRRLCRQFARLLDADTVAAYLHDPATDLLVPTAGYHIPPQHVAALAQASLPLSEQGFHLPLWRDRRPVHSEDVAGDARFGHPLFRRFPHQSGLLVPLVLGDQVAGAFYVVWWTARRAVTADELGLVDDIAARVSLYLRNLRLWEQGERDRHRLEALNEVARRLAAVHETDEVLALIVSEAARLVGGEAAGLRLREGDDLVVRARTEAAAALMARPRIRVGESLSGVVVATEKPVVVDDLGADTRYDPDHKRHAIELGFKSFLGAPLRAAGRCIGSLNVYTTGTRRFQADDIALLSAFADQAALAIDKASLLRATEQRRQVLADLSRVALSMQASWDRDSRLAAFVRGAHEVVGFDRVNVFLPSADGARIELVTGTDGSVPIALSLSPEAGVFYQAWQTRRPIAVVSDEDLQRIAPLHAAYAGHPYLRTRRFVVAPLIVGDRAVGLASADNKGTRRPIDPASVEPFFLLCQQLAAALEESRLYAETQAREREAAQLYAVTREMATSLDADRLLDVITRNIIDVLGADAAGIYRYDQRRQGLVFQRGLHLDPELTENLVLKPGEGVAGRAFHEQRPVWTADRLADPSLAYTSAAGRLVTARAPRAYLAVPILSRGEVHGVLVAYFFAPHDFSRNEVQVLSALADHAALAIENARLFSETHRQERRLAQIFDSTSDGILLVSDDGMIRAANRRAGELLGLDAGAAIGTSLAEVLGGLGGGAVAAKGVFAELPALLARRLGSEQGDFELPRLGRIVHWVAQPAVDAEDSTTGFTLTLHDVTQEREVSRMKSDFVSFVTHQLRTPLAGIRWMLELASGEALPAEAASYVDDARDATGRLIGLVNDLLDISRLESGRLSFDPRPVDLADLTRSVLDEVALVGRDKAHRLRVAVAPDLPAVTADPQLIRQVVLNLVSNAVKYTPPGGDIAITLDRDGKDVRWAVRDTGIGIPRDAQPRLFEKFYRADNVHTVETEGTGLGLYLVKLIVERHGGRVWCESAEGEGSMFAFTLPG